MVKEEVVVRETTRFFGSVCGRHSGRNRHRGIDWSGLWTQEQGPG
jgi:hypothetical protein